MVTRWRFANQPWLRDINRLEHQKANGDIVGHWLRPSHQEASQATLESRRPAVRHRQVVAGTGTRLNSPKAEIGRRGHQVGGLLSAAASYSRCRPLAVGRFRLPIDRFKPGAVGIGVVPTSCDWYLLRPTLDMGTSMHLRGLTLSLRRLQLDCSRGRGLHQVAQLRIGEHLLDQFAKAT